MSRILRRPLFRGGPVSSYGTGIASGLADGGRVGFRTGGSYTSQVTNPGFTGGEIMEFIRNNPSKEGLSIFDSSMLKSKNPRRYFPMSASQKMGSQRGAGTYTPFNTLASKEGEGQTDFEAVYRNMITSPMDYDFSEVKSQEEEKEKIENFGNKSIAEIIAENEERKEKVMDESGTADDRMTDDTMTIKQKEMTGEIDTRPSKEALKLAGIEETGKIEPVNMDGEEANELGIQELADSYYKALKGDTEERNQARIKKARGQDIGDWLLKYSEQVGEKGDWKDAASSTAGWIADRGPSRTEVIQEKITAKDDALREAGVKMAITETIGDKKLDKQFANQLKLMDKRVAGTIAAALAKSNDTDFDKIQKTILDPDASAQEKSLAYTKLGLSGNFDAHMETLMSKQSRNIKDTEALGWANTYFGTLSDGPIILVDKIDLGKDGIQVDKIAKKVVQVKDGEYAIIGNYSAG
jgi:hypothetical protein